MPPARPASAPMVRPVRRVLAIIVAAVPVAVVVRVAKVAPAVRVVPAVVVRAIRVPAAVAVGRQQRADFNFPLLTGEGDQVRTVNHSSSGARSLRKRLAGSSVSSNPIAIPQNSIRSGGVPRKPVTVSG